MISEDERSDNHLAGPMEDISNRELVINVDENNNDGQVSFEYESKFMSMYTDELDTLGSEILESSIKLSYNQMDVGEPKEDVDVLEDGKLESKTDAEEL